jgi:hypothetical protein
MTPWSSPADGSLSPDSFRAGRVVATEGVGKERKFWKSRRQGGAHHAKLTRFSFFSQFDFL